MPETNQELTPGMVRGYIAGHGALCLFCRGPDLESDGLDAEADCVWAAATCAGCGREWQDVYYLGAVGLVAGDGSIAMVGPA